MTALVSRTLAYIRPLAWFLTIGFVLSASPRAQSLFEREAEVRRLALRSSIEDELWHEHFASEAWTQRVLAFDAAGRALATGLQETAALTKHLLDGIRDAHPNVRAQALIAWRASGKTPVPLEDARTLARDVLPLVRLELARTLARVGCERGHPEVWALTTDSDDRVAVAARRALASHGDPGSVRKYVMGRIREGDLETLCALAVDWTRLRPGEVLLDSLAKDVDLIDPSGHRLTPSETNSDESNAAPVQGEVMEKAARARVWRNMLELVRLAVHNQGDASRAVRGWLALAEADGVQRATRKALLLAASRSGDLAFGRALLDALVALGPEEEDLSSEGAEAALACLSTELLIEEGLLREALIEDWDQLLPGAARRMNAWDPALGRRLWARRPGAALDAFETTFVRFGDEGTARLLAEALDAPQGELRVRAFRALASPAGIRAEGPALFEAWQALDPDERRSRLAWLPRDVAFPALREVLLEQGAGGGEERRVAVELLAPFAGDAEVRKRVASWLAEDLERLRSARASGEEERSFELWVQGELRALSRIDAEGSVNDFATALLAGAGLSSEVGKVAAAALSASAAGRRTLATSFATRPAPGIEELDRRTRIEAALGLAPHAKGADQKRVLAVLIEDYPRAGWDLGVRMIAAIGRFDDPNALAFLGALTLDRSLGAEQRIAAVEALAKGSFPEALPFLSRALREAPDLETRVVALDAMGAMLEAAGGNASARRVAEQTLTEATAFVLAGCSDAERSREGLEGWAHLREALLLAWGRAPSPPPAALESTWLSAVRAEAEAQLIERFSGEAPRSSGFAWRGEIALARVLSRSSRLEGALATVEDWYVLDARLLLALATDANAAKPKKASTDGVDALVRASLVAFLGEPDSEAAERLRAQAHLLTRAGRGGQWALVERLAGNLLAPYREGEVSERVWSEVMGRFDRERGIDPCGRLAAAVFQARSWQALQAEDLEAAAGHAAEAGRGLEFSGAAREAQERLVAALQQAAEAHTGEPGR